MKGTEQFLEKMIDHIELSTTGTLNFAEFLVLMVKSQGVNGVQHAFLSYDVDGSGSITREELKAGVGTGTGPGSRRLSPGIRVPVNKIF